MIFTYDVLEEVINTGKPIVINDKTQIQKLDGEGINAVTFVSKDWGSCDYYDFLELNPGKGIVIYSDGNSFDGFSVFEIPLSEFYFDVNTEKGIIGIEDGVGNQTDFLDLFTGPAVGEFTRKYVNSTDEEIKESKEYQMTDRYISDYLGYEGAEEEKINLALLRFAMATYTDQNQPR